MPGFNPQQEQEFVNLLVGHQSMIRAFVISQMPGMPEVDDVIQQTNEVLWTKRESFTLGTNFKAWALTTARFQIMAHHQRVKSLKRATLDEDVMMMMADEIEELEIDDMNRQLEDLQECLSQLQVQDQELVLHRYWKNSGLIEYASTTRRSIGALKVALYRVRDRLRDCMERKRKIREGMA